MPMLTDVLVRNARAPEPDADGRIVLWKICSPL